MAYFERKVIQSCRAFNPTPSDTEDEDVAFFFRVLADGAVKVTTVGGSDFTIAGLYAGDIVDWVVCKRIWSTGTTITTPATNIECYSE